MRPTAGLIITSSPKGQQGQHFQLQRRTLAGGRDPAREIQILDFLVSRKHFLVRWRDGAHVIVDTEALNGLFVNGSRVRERELRYGDEIQMGDTRMVYRKGDQQLADAVEEYRRADPELRNRTTMLCRRSGFLRRAS